MTKIPVSKIAISGAGGWLGRELLEVLISQWGWEAVRDNVICIGSSPRFLLLSNGQTLQLVTFSEAFEFGKLDGFVHLAFQTRDKVQTLGHAAYVNANLSITSSALQLIQSTNPNWVATVSSGAVLESPQSTKLEKNIANNPYGFLKNVEETMLKSMCQQQNINLSIGRLWGAGGSYMPINPAYALSDFITSALSHNSIRIKAPHTVKRRYCDASSFMKVLLLSALNSKESVFNSGGDEVELGDLAQLIGGKTGAQVHRENFNPTLPSDSYFPTDSSYANLCDQYGIPYSSLDDVVSCTLKGHEKQLSITPR